MRSIASFLPGRPLLAGIATALAVAACGGGVEPPGLALDLSAATPAEHAGSLVLAPDAVVSNELRPPDGTFAEPYCLVRFSRAVQADGRSYDFAFAFDAQDRRVLVVTLTHRPEAWFVAAYRPSVAAATLDLPRRQLTLRQLRSTQGSQVGFEATLDGVLRFPPLAESAACG